VQEGVEVENGPHPQIFDPPYLENWLSDSNEILQIFSGNQSL